MTKEIHDAVSDSVSTERALDLALEALDIVKIHFTQNRHVNDAITAIKQARSAPAQEPVAWMFEDDEGDKHKTFR